MKRTLTDIAAQSMLLCLLAGIVSAQQPPIQKKLIEYGWDVPAPSYVAQHIREMEKLPFEGIIMRIPKAGGIFTKKKYSDADFAAELDALRKIEWRKFTDNFICLYAASDMDWFSDADWEAVKYNVRFMAKAAVAGRCKGLCFDAEPYGNNPWAYKSNGKSFAECQAQARKRGAEFMQAIQEEMPNAVIHTFFILSIFRGLMEEPDLAKREEVQSKAHYALYPAFFNGMLDVVKPTITLTDGNESSYYYQRPIQFYEAYHAIKQRALTFVAPGNVSKYKLQVQASQALYVDHLFALRSQKYISSALSPEDRARWFEQNVCYALRTSDEYVWLYSEKMSWWANEKIPPGLLDAVISAKQKRATREPINIDMQDTFKQAQEKMEAELRAKLIKRSAKVRRVPDGAKPPAIDGKLDDAAWQNTKPLDEFVKYVTLEDVKVTAPTIVRVGYDKDNLYLAFECIEPAMKAVKIVGANRDDSVWMGDSIDIFLSADAEKPNPHVHFILNPDNVQWDATFTTDNDMTFDPKWQSATSKGEKSWTAEIAIPWSEMKMECPAPGATRRANVGRNRVGAHEAASWSQCISGFMDTDCFGTWTFE